VPRSPSVKNFYENCTPLKVINVFTCAKFGDNLFFMFFIDGCPKLHDSYQNSDDYYKQQLALACSRDAIPVVMDQLGLADRLSNFCSHASLLAGGRK
jgi:hypothetical protein